MYKHDALFGGRSVSSGKQIERLILRHRGFAKKTVTLDKQQIISRLPNLQGCCLYYSFPFLLAEFH